MDADRLRATKREQVRAWLGTGSINVFGVQFSGKDTQCKRLAAWLGAPVLGGGDILRNTGQTPAHVQEMMHRGELVPIEYFLTTMTPYFAREEFAGKPLLLSAVGRYFGEEQGVMQATEAAGHPIRAAVILELPEELVWQRWHVMHDLMDREARADDTETGLRRRLERFEHDTKPVLAFYERLGLAVHVDGSQPPETVEEAIVDVLYQRAEQADAAV